MIMIIRQNANKSAQHRNIDASSSRRLILFLTVLFKAAWS